MDVAFVVFLLTYVVIALGQPPLFRIDRTGAAIIGASLMVILGVLTIQDAYDAIDYKTILILFGMMILIANLRLSGFFGIVLSFLSRNLRNPLVLFYALIFVSGLLSAFFVNDTVCLIFTPFILELTRRMNVNPKPYLLALAMSANIGSAATITGNPQNIIIGAASGISYSEFFVRLFPVSLISLVIAGLVIHFFYRNDIKNEIVEIKDIRYKYNKALVIKSSLMALLTVVLFFLNVPMHIVAIGVGAFLLITRRVKPEKVYSLVDFELLILFIGLFIVVRGFENSIVFGEMVNYVKQVVNTPLSLVVSSALLSNIVSNVPAVLIFKPMMGSLFNSQDAWLYLAMSSTFAGNLTILGSIANIIVIESASPKVKISFLEYLKIGVPVTILSILFGFLVLSIW
jgi:Na+/H+ antiporter NhaD/arsenite permease-like protein